MKVSLIRALIALTVIIGTSRAALGQGCLTVTCSTNKTTSCGMTLNFDTPTVGNCIDCGGATGYTITVLYTTTNGKCPQYVTRTWGVTNNCHDSMQCSQTIEVVTTNQPVIQGATNIVVYSCGGGNVTVYYNPTATAACCINPSIVCTPPSGSSFPPGVSEVTCVATDCCGNSSTDIFYVGVIEEQPLQVTCSNKTVSCGSTWSFDQPSISDGCCSSTNFTITGLTPVTNGNCPQVISKTWEVTDACGYSNQCTEMVTVVNTNTPVFQGVNNLLYYSCSATPLYFSVFATSPCCGNVTVVCNPASGVVRGPGSVTTVNCTATDCCGNTASTSFTLTVQTPPFEVYCNGNKTVYSNTTWSFDTPYVQSGCCGNTSNTLTALTPVTNGFSPLTITETWLVNDACGDSNKCSQTVTVIAAPPVTICPANNPPEGTVGVSAGSSLALYAPMQNPSHTAPMLTGMNTTGKYADGWRYSYILYGPTMSWSPARVNVLPSGNNLFICVEGLPMGVGDTPSYVSIGFDPAQTGGQMAGSGHMLFTQFDNGNSQASRGDGAGCYEPAEDITNWSAAMSVQGDSQWTAEFEIPLSLLGGGAPDTAIGFHVSHNNITGEGESFSWPKGSLIDAPDTWSPLHWVGPGMDTTVVELDQQRITQGLEYDVTAGLPYVVVQGKDTLVRVQLYTRGPNLTVTNFAVVVTPPGGNSFGYTIQGGPVGQPTMNTTPHGAFTGGGDFQAWIDGSAYLSSTFGEYSFKALVTLEGDSTAQVLDLGTVNYVRTEDVHLVLTPFVNPYDPTSVPCPNP